MHKEYKAFSVSENCKGSLIITERVKEYEILEDFINRADGKHVDMNPEDIRAIVILLLDIHKHLIIDDIAGSI